MILFRGLLLNFTVSVTLFLMTVVSIAGVIERVIAIVNDDVILESELEVAIATYEKNEDLVDVSGNVSGTFKKEIRDRVLAFLVDEKLIEQAINSSGITVTLEEVDAAIEHIKDLNGLYELETTLRSDGIKMEEFRRDLEGKILRRKFVDGQIYSRVVITEDKIKSYYDDNMDMYAGELEYQLYTVLIKSSADVESEKYKTLLADILDFSNQLGSGVDFNHAVKSWSLNETVGEDGYIGFVGAFTKSELSDDVMEAIEGLAIGDYTPIIKTEHGTQFFYINDLTKTETRPLEMVRDEIYQILLSEEYDFEFATWLNSLKNCSSVELFNNDLLS